MAITGTVIASRARTILNDVAGTRWTDAEILGWINDGRRDMAALQPKLWGNTAKRTVVLTAGCYQRLNLLAGMADVFALDNVVNNVREDDSAGPVVRPTTRLQMDSFDPGWRSKTGTNVQNWFKDESNHFGFWVYPAVDGGKLDVEVSVSPSDITSLSDVVVPIDVMATTLLNYVMFRAYSKETESEKSVARAASYLQLFTATAAPSKE